MNAAARNAKNTSCGLTKAHGGLIIEDRKDERIGLIGQAVLLLGVGAFAGSLWYEKPESVWNASPQVQKKEEFTSSTPCVIRTHPMRFEMDYALRNDNIAAVKRMLAAGYDAHCVDGKGRNTLCLATSPDMMRLLLACGGNAHTNDIRGHTSRDHAIAYHKNPEIIRLLEAAQ